MVEEQFLKINKIKIKYKITVLHVVLTVRICVAYH